jgi:aspartyl-tRNA(Asn)/glutamyl-tRNA(Gln) amidotransferase subunit B
VKNLNSFRNVEKALEYEIQRQITLILEGGSVVQETMMWDAGAQQTRTMRSKEQAHDYRYFPEPDLPHVKVNEQLLEELRITLPELGLQKKKRFRTQYGLPAYDAGILVEDAAVAAYYEAAVGHLRQPSVETYKQVSNWIMTEILRVMGEKKVAINEVGLSPLQLASLVNVVADGVISSKTAKDILPELYASEQTADQIVESQGLRQMSDEGALQAIVDDILAANPENVEKYREGKTKLLGFFVGQVLKATDGTANPTIATALMKAALDGPLDI